jgi:hypothetical protein
MQDNCPDGVIAAACVGANIGCLRPKFAENSEKMVQRKYAR